MVQCGPNLLVLGSMNILELATMLLVPRHVKPQVSCQSFHLVDATLVIKLRTFIERLNTFLMLLEWSLLA